MEELSLHAQSSRIPIMSTSTGTWVNGEDMVSEYWQHGLRNPILFSSAISALNQSKYSTFVEIGPQPALLGPIARTLRDNQSTNLIATMRRSGDNFENLLGTVCRFWECGYDVNWESLFTRKYDCISLPPYEFAKETLRPTEAIWRSSRNNLATTENNELFGKSNSDDLYRIVWKKRNLTVNNGESNNKISGNWIIFSDQQGLGDALRATIHSLGANCTLLKFGESFATSANDVRIRKACVTDIERVLSNYYRDGNNISGIVFLGACDNINSFTDHNSFNSHLEDCTRCIIDTVQALEPLNQTPKLWFVSRGAQAINQNDMISDSAPVHAAIWGMARVLRLERPDLWGGIIDLDPNFSSVDISSRQIINSISTFTSSNDTQSASAEDQIVYRGDQLYCARLQYYTLPLKPVDIKSNVSYLITGWTGALGGQFVNWLAESGATHIILVSRSLELSITAQKNIDRLRDKGISIENLRCDICEFSQLQNLFSTIKKRFPPLKGIFHAAGALDDKTINNQTWQKFQHVFNPKALAAYYLHHLSLSIDLDLFVLFSSASAIIGSSGQVSYVAANASLDALAQYRRVNNLPALSLNWGLWSGEGMASSSSDNLVKRWREFGIDTIIPDRALSLFGRILNSDLPQIMILPIDWSVYIDRIKSLAGDQPLLREIQTEYAAIKPVSSEVPVVNKELLKIKEMLDSQLKGSQDTNNEMNPQEFIDAYLTKLLNSILGHSEDKHIDSQLGFFDMGFDSLTAVEARNRLQNELSIKLAPSVIFNYPTLERLSNHLYSVLVPNVESTVNLLNYRSKDTIFVTDGKNEYLQLNDESLASLVDQEINEILGMDTETTL